MKEYSPLPYIISLYRHTACNNIFTGGKYQKGSSRLTTHRHTHLNYQTSSHTILNPQKILTSKDKMAPENKSSIKIDAGLHDWLLSAITESGAQLRVPSESTPTPKDEPETPPKTEGPLQPQTETLTDTDNPPTHTRKLVTIKQVNSVTHLDKTHNLVNIEGWNVVVRKSKSVASGELVIFVEVDSFLPAGGKYEQLFAEVGNLITFEGVNGYRVGTKTHISGIKKKLITQGHVYSLVDFPPIFSEFQTLKYDFKFTRQPTDNDDGFVAHLRQIDFTSHLGVRKWETAAETATGKNAAAINSSSCCSSSGTSGTVKAKYPAFILKTNTERMENCPNLFTKDKYRSMVFQESVKMDGASMTVYFVHKDSRYFSHLGALSDPAPKHAVHPNGRFGVCSKNRDYAFTDDPKKHGSYPYWLAAVKDNFHVKLPALGQTIAVQGELVGWNINGNNHGYAKNAYDIFVFSVFQIEGSRRWDPEEVELFAKEHWFKHVPVRGYYTIPQIARKHDDLQARAELTCHEGLVYKNCTDGRWFKALSKRYILERGDEAQASKAANGGMFGERGEKTLVSSFERWQMPEDEAEELFRAWEEEQEVLLGEDAALAAWFKAWEEEWNAVTQMVSNKWQKKTEGLDANLEKSKESRRRELIEWLGL
ncbi:hypothetical protein B0H66DRAFT_621418 [Apodospora peruviana]|uniref:RNA ligase domain-containing protein n=1 Tax=Apodospora peruviana TaxID=516989 RepID=A0AAE0M3F8_9PEZI|nr:hypothetical protein B0H66DRAFT_621418 [Apodospora peruviana]